MSALTAGLSRVERRKTSERITRTLDLPLSDFYLVFGCGLLLSCLGLLMVVSSSSVIAAVDAGDPYYYGRKQFVFWVAGALLALVMVKVSARFLERIAWPAWGLAVVLNLLTRSPLGTSVGDNHNWISFGPSFTQFQPSEFTKFALIVWCAHYLARRARLLDDLRQWVVYLIGAFTLVGIIGIYEGDMGSALILAAITMAVLFVAGVPWRLLLVLGACGLAMIALLIVTNARRLSLLVAMFHRDQNTQGENMQPLRSLYALASGGWFGVGLGAGRQKWGLLAEAHTDYIFAIIGEELGLVGTASVIALFAILAYAGIRVALRCDDVFTRFLAVGITAWFTIQAFLNIAVVLGLTPVMGITLPFISYGGSGLMANLIALGCLAGCAQREPHARRVLTTSLAEQPSTIVSVGGSRRRGAVSEWGTSVESGEDSSTWSRGDESRDRAAIGSGHGGWR